MKLLAAQNLAEALAGAMMPGAERLEIGGSIRREKAEVKDIEIVVIPRWREEAATDVQGGMFDAPPVVRVNCLREVVEDLEETSRLTVIKPGTQEIEPWHLTDDGRYWRLYLHRQGIKVDVFIATPETWGMVYMIRTGSGVGPDGSPLTGFAPAMLARWKQVSGGGYSKEARLWRPAHREPEPTPEERDVFEACRVRYIPPEQRLSSADVHRNALNEVAA